MSSSRMETSTLVGERLGDEGHAFDDILTLLWRRRYFIAAFCAVGVMIAGAVTTFMPNRYTSEVVIQARFARQDQKPQSDSSVAVDAASVVRTELNLIASREMAEAVATRLALANDPEFDGRKSLARRALGLISFWDPRFNLENSSATVALKLMKNLSVTNDANSFLIRISYTSTTPERSARIANAFAEEYLRTSKETAARRQLADLSAIYGPRHPIILQAQSQLEKALADPGVSESAQILTRASPPTLPSGPNRPLILAFILLGSLGAGVVTVLALERANTSFRTDAELVAHVKAPCLGIFAEGLATAGLESARAIAMATGLATQSSPSKVLLITSSVPEEGESLVSTAVARSLARMGRRTLFIDLSREDPKNAPASNSGALKRPRALKRVLDSLQHHPLQLDRQLTVLRSALTPRDNQNSVTSPSFLKLLEHAREQCDLVIIGAPPVMMSADALYLGRHADFVLHVVRWNSTPRRAVLAALDRLRNFGTPVDGVILSRVHKKEYQRLSGCVGTS
jgi:Mrp family chromosome partitioning ATPase